MPVGHHADDGAQTTRDMCAWPKRARRIHRPMSAGSLLLSRRALFEKGSLSIERGDLPFQLARTPGDRPEHADEHGQGEDDQRGHLRRRTAFEHARER